MKSHLTVLVLLILTITATASSFQVMSKDLPFQPVERGSSSNTNSHITRITLTLSESNITIVRGSTAQVDLHIGLTPSNSFRVSLSSQQVPSSVTVSFSPISARVSFVSTMTIIANNASSVGHFDLTVVASGGGVTRVAGLSVLEVALVHNLAVISASGPATATVGKIVTVNATIANYGSVPESYAVNLYANSSLVVSEQSTALLPFTERSTILSWNTSGFAVGKYGLVVAVPPVPGELDIRDNYIQGGSILLVQTPTGNPSPPIPSPGSTQPAPANLQALAFAVAIVWIIAVALVLFRERLRTANRRTRL